MNKRFHPRERSYFCVHFASLHAFSVLFTPLCIKKIDKENTTLLKLRKQLAADKAKCISGNGDSDDKVFCLVVAIYKKHFALIRRSKYSGTYIQGTSSGPRQVSPEWRLGWGLIIINQKK